MRKPCIWPSSVMRCWTFASTIDELVLAQQVARGVERLVEDDDLGRPAAVVERDERHLAATARLHAQAGHDAGDQHGLAPRLQARERRAHERRELASHSRDTDGRTGRSRARPFRGPAARRRVQSRAATSGSGRRRAPRRTATPARPRLPRARLRPARRRPRRRASRAARRSHRTRRRGSAPRRRAD